MKNFKANTYLEVSSTPDRSVVILRNVKTGDYIVMTSIMDYNPVAKALLPGEAFRLPSFQEIGRITNSLVTD